MSSPTWTPASLSPELLREYGGRVWRLVDAQYAVSTRKLVDSFTDQKILESLVDVTKPSVPGDCQDLHPFLSTPFRYAPYPKGSRFRRAGHTPGVYYAAQEQSAAVAETAFYRLLFFAESPKTPWPVNPLEFTAFSVEVRSPRSLDLTKPPLDKMQSVWRDPVQYEPCQSLADGAREIDTEIIRYASARSEGVCIAILTCRAFAEAWPQDFQTWRIGVSHRGAYAIREFPDGPERLEFDRYQFRDSRIYEMPWRGPKTLY